MRNRVRLKATYESRDLEATESHDQPPARARPALRTYGRASERRPRLALRARTLSPPPLRSFQPPARLPLPHRTTKGATIESRHAASPEQRACVEAPHHRGDSVRPSSGTEMPPSPYSRPTAVPPTRRERPARASLPPPPLARSPRR
ncbi:hypothetical protein JB92DRAFT_3135606 [Gautieria morchelliformis]|nr:hypothetical protein JB92DRAFT_3135606 [Gautieria morchelliformis]